MFGGNAAIATGTGSWAGAYTKARALVSQMTLEEKVSTYIAPLPSITVCNQN